MLILMNIKSPSKYIIRPTPDILYIIILNMNFQMFDILQTNDLQKNKLMRLFNFFFDKQFRLSLFINRYILYCVKIL